HTCGLTATGAVYCWGNNGFGQLGDGGVENNVATPIQVEGSGSGSLVFTSVSAGFAHTCGVTTAQEAYCWGDNGFGQLGDSTNTTRFVPTRVASGATTFTQVSAGSFHTCALDAAGAAYCWGYNIVGQLGTGVAGAGTEADAPVAVSGGETFSSVQAGSGHTCAISSAIPAVYCWGDNAFGQLGDGTNIQRLAPWPALAEATVLSVSEGHSCSVDPYGDAYCWGRNHRGQLGNGTSTNSPTPTPVLDGRVWTDISAGYSHTC
ncbi:MAG: RCC1 repeat-containing protein, partial [Gammaproteobacteria bacterium]|nr:RCC1 repeat-containing protein [Gemmatimonadota bacterium]NIU72528.1 RCC1 repeat-containing protein [Gammaproteobacteria bacterium]NIY07140.1 RCC1 repeat-containing protein [Gemmatimonadota bacterium]